MVLLHLDNLNNCFANFTNAAIYNLDILSTEYSFIHTIITFIYTVILCQCFPITALLSAISLLVAKQSVNKSVCAIKRFGS